MPMHWLIRSGISLALALCAGGAAQGQSFSSGSDGSDGALSFAPGSGTVTLTASSFNPPLDPDNDNVYHFTTISIPAGVTVRLGAQQLGYRPVYWLATGTVNIAGTLDLRGIGYDSPGAGGWPGGRGALDNYQPAKPGSGPGAGGVPGGYGGGGAGHATVGSGTGSPSPAGSAYGNAQLIPLLGGSGGGGAYYLGTGTGNGGAGGGAILIASSQSITVTGTITAKGGGGTQSGTNSWGGNGSGGAIRLMAPLIHLPAGGVLDVSPGSGGTAASHGRLRVEAFERLFHGTLNATAYSFGLPGLVFPLVTYPTLRVTHVNGVTVTSAPTGSFSIPDVAMTANPSTGVTILLEASNIPVGTSLNLTVTSADTGAEATIVTAPSSLSGTLELSTSSAVVKFPPGFTRMTLRATW